MPNKEWLMHPWCCSWEPIFVFFFLNLCFLHFTSPIPTTVALVRFFGMLSWHNMSEYSWRLNISNSFSAFFFWLKKFKLIFHVLRMACLIGSSILVFSRWKCLQCSFQFSMWFKNNLFVRHVYSHGTSIQAFNFPLSLKQGEEIWENYWREVIEIIISTLPSLHITHALCIHSFIHTCIQTYIQITDEK